MAVLWTRVEAAWLEGRESEWQGFRRVDFTLPGDGATCTVVEPRRAAAGMPWIWRARFFGHQPALDVALLESGFHLAYCDVAGLYGAPEAVARWDRFYELATRNGWSRRPVLEGMSRGGLIIFNWASANPGKVAAIYGDNPVCDFRSWPGGKNGKFSERDWESCLAAYGLTAEEAAAHPQPVSPDVLRPIAERGIPVALVLGTADEVVPASENGEALADAYRTLGGPVRVWRKPGQGHHPHGLHPPDELAAFLHNAVGEKPLSARPNILFLLSDDQRPDTIAALGNPRIETPNLDRLVGRGMTFSRATCSYPICVVSRAEILSGMHGWENGVTGMPGAVPRPGIAWWAETLRDAGYDTCYVGKWHTNGRPSARGFTEVNGLFGAGGGKWWKEDQRDWKGFPITGYRGWVFQSDDGKEKYPERGVGVTPDISAKFADAAIELIGRAPARPWFLQVNFTAPHDPLFVPPGYEGKYAADAMALPENFRPEHPFDHGNLRGRDEELLAWPRTPEAVRDLLRVYYAVIDDMDRQIGRILDALEKSGEMDNTIVIFSSDHGMGCGSHGLRGKQNMYEHTINVPLVVAGPGIAPGSRTDAQVYLRELYPTSCELAGVPVPSAVTAESFAPVLRGEKETHHEEIHGYFTDTQRMVRTADGWKLIRYPRADRWQLFNLNEDPWEMNDLSDDPGAAVRFGEMRKRLAAWRKAAGDPLLGKQDG
jgi:arylsulfatase A-like enzyme